MGSLLGSLTGEDGKRNIILSFIPILFCLFVELPVTRIKKSKNLCNQSAQISFEYWERWLLTSKICESACALERLSFVNTRQ